jgi:AcrR family transcriptional regulator
MNQTENPIAVKSKKWIMESLIDLMNHKNFQDITVDKLTEHAGLGRKTFYRNFNSKEDVLNAYLNNLINQFVIHLSSVDVITPKIALFELFTLCEKNQSFLLGLKRSKMLGYLLEEWNATLPGIHDLMLDKIPNFPNSNSKIALEYTLAFNAGGVWNVLVKWVNTGMQQTPEELTEIVMKLVEFDMVQLK